MQVDALKASTRLCPRARILRRLARQDPVWLVCPETTPLRTPAQMLHNAFRIVSVTNRRSMVRRARLTRQKRFHPPLRQTCMCDGTVYMRHLSIYETLYRGVYDTSGNSVECHVAASTYE